MIGSVPDTYEERMARNEALFRDLNQAQPVSGEGLESFLCECGSLGCTTRIELTLGEYLDVRAHRRRFAIAPGHDIAGVEVVVDRRERYWTVEKGSEVGHITG